VGTSGGNRNGDDPWSETDLADLQNELELGATVEEIADFLSRDADEVKAKIDELGYVQPGSK
jgi:hypothetical protein